MPGLMWLKVAANPVRETIEVGGRERTRSKRGAATIC